MRASDQKAIENGTSDVWVAARHELVECYVLAFQALMDFGFTFRVNFTFMSEPKTIDGVLEKIERQNERFESVMKMARLQEPSMEAALLGGCTASYW